MLLVFTEQLSVGLIYPQSDEELVKVDGPAPVAVKLLKQSCGLVLLHHDPVVV